MYQLERVAQVKVKPNMAILSLICNVERSSEILMRTFKVFIQEGINVSMMSQGASKVWVLSGCVVMILDEGGGRGGGGRRREGHGRMKCTGKGATDVRFSCCNRHVLNLTPACAAVSSVRPPPL